MYRVPSITTILTNPPAKFFILFFFFSLTDADLDVSSFFAEISDPSERPFDEIVSLRAEI